MQLPQTIIDELRDILSRNVGENVNNLSDDELNQLGDFVLTTLATSLKVRARQHDDRVSIT